MSHLALDGAGEDVESATQHYLAQLAAERRRKGKLLGQCAPAVAAAVAIHMSMPSLAAALTVCLPVGTLTGRTKATLPRPCPCLR